jgi:hypothetical protein
MEGKLAPFGLAAQHIPARLQMMSSLARNSWNRKPRGLIRKSASGPARIKLLLLPICSFQPSRPARTKRGDCLFHLASDLAVA